MPILYKNAKQTLTKGDLEKEFKDNGLTIKSISSNIIGTGTIVVTDKATYTVLIYGDVDGNGKINVNDALAIVRQLLNEDAYKLKTVNRLAANVYTEKVDEINVLDALKIVRFILGEETSIIDSLPTPDENNNETVDYITNVTFEIDQAKLKTDYIDGEKISLDGITAYAIYKYAGKTKISDDLICNITNVAYDRVNEANNSGRKVNVSYIATNPMDGTKTTYNTEYSINVKKQFETIDVVGNTFVNRVEIYDTTKIATIVSGNNEINITDNIDIIVTPNDKDADNCCEPKAWLKESSVENALDLYFYGVKGNTDYQITLKSKSNSKYVVAKTFIVKVATSNVVNTVKANKITAEDGVTETNRFEVGCTAEINLYNMYKKVNPSLNREVEHLLKMEISDLISITNINELQSAGFEITMDSTAIYVKAKDSVIAAAEGTDVTINIKVAEQVLNYTLKVYEKSKYQLELVNKSDITFTLKETTNIGGYDIAKINGIYYTILPIRIHDQYGKNKDVTASDLSTDKLKIDKIVFDVGNSQYIDVIGINKNGNIYELDSSKAISYVGIAIKDGCENHVENGTLAVYFEGAKVKEFNPILIERKDVSTLEYYESDEEYTRTAYCYEKIDVAQITSGAKQKNITESDLAKIGCIIVQDGKDDIDIVGQQDLADLDISYAVNNGIVTISFKAKYEGTYHITPYINVNGTKIEVIADEDSKTKSVTVMEDYSINKVIFTNGESFGEEYFGTASIDSKKSSNVTFYHEYTANDRRPLNNVNYDRIKFANIDTNNISKIETKSNGIVLDNPTGIDNAYIDAIRVAIPKDASIGESEFTIIVDNSKYDKADYTGNFKVKVKEKLVANGLDIGFKNNSITLYSSLPDSNPNNDNVVLVDGYYYTIVPISLIANDNGNTVEVNGIKSTMLLQDLNTKADADGKITFIDNTYESNYEDTVISVKGFKVIDNKYEEVTGEEMIDYIGIAILDQSFFNAENLDSNEWTDDYWENSVRLKTITIYCNKYWTNPMTITVNKGN